MSIILVGFKALTTLPTIKNALLLIVMLQDLSISYYILQFNFIAFFAIRGLQIVDPLHSILMNQNIFLEKDLCME